MKIRFKQNGDRWLPDEGNKFLSWQDGVIVIWISKTDVGLGNCREPLGSQPRDKVVNDWLDEHVELVGA